ncbi:MAG TPA: transposase [Thermomicrobiales bacterium]|nr:transposase [Thermomicrobiales bacterium]
MLGPPKARCPDRPVLVSLEALVPPDHFYRHLDAALDLSFVREWVAGCYAERGRPSIDLVVFFKLQLILFFEGLRSERRLMETASLNLAHRWYLGYHLDEPLPDHASLTRIRQRLGLATFRRFFDHVVQRCVDAGLVWGEELFFDATKVRANAALDSLVPACARSSTATWSTSSARAGPTRRRPERQAPMRGVPRAASTRPLPPGPRRRTRHWKPSRPPGAGTCWKRAGSTRTARPRAAISARAGWWSAPPTRMRPR